MAYMEMFGNCSHTASIEGANNVANSEYVRHSVHLVQQWHQSAAQSLDTGLTSTVSCSFMHQSATSSYSLRSHSPTCNGQVIPPALPPKQRRVDTTPTVPLTPPSSPSPPSPPVTSTPLRRETPPPATPPPAGHASHSPTPSAEPELMEMVEVAHFLVFKKPEEDGPDIRGGYGDALIVHATKTHKKGQLNMSSFLMCFIYFSFK